jgi:hypothetical protein
MILEGNALTVIHLSPYIHCLIDSDFHGEFVYLYDTVSPSVTPVKKKEAISTEEKLDIIIPPEKTWNTSAVQLLWPTVLHVQLATMLNRSPYPTSKISTSKLLKSPC